MNRSPRVTECLAGRGVAPVQLGRLEGGELGRRCLGVRGLIDRLQRGGDGLAVGGGRRTASRRGSGGPRRFARSLPARPVSDRFGEACQTVAADDQYIPGTPRLASSAQTAAQNLAPSFACTQMPSTCDALHVDADGEMGGLVAHVPAVTDLDDDRVEEDHRVEPLPAAAAARSGSPRRSGRRFSRLSRG